MTQHKNRVIGNMIDTIYMYCALTQNNNMGWCYKQCCLCI